MNVNELRKIIPWQELDVIEHSRELKKIAQKMAESIDSIPALYKTDGKDTTCVLHYFNITGSGDWYVFELDQETGEAYGFMTESGSMNDPFAEFGYFDVSGLCRQSRINLDLYFDGITKSEIIKRRKSAA